MHKLLEKAITELAALPEDQQGLVAARLLEEMKRLRTSDKRRRWARVADRLARLDALKGQSAAFAQHTGSGPLKGHGYTVGLRPA